LAFAALASAVTLVRMAIECGRGLNGAVYTLLPYHQYQADMKIGYARTQRTG